MQPFEQASASKPIHRPTCARCGSAIEPIDFAPSGPQDDLRTFHCASCGYTVREAMEVPTMWR